MLETQESELLSAFLDKELIGSDLKMVQTRLAESVEWREELERLKKTKNYIAALPPVTIPLDFLASLEKEVESHTQKRRFSFFEWAGLSSPWVWGGSFATAAIFAGVLFVRQPWQSNYIPLDALVAAHSTGQRSTLINEKVLAASTQSEKIKNHA